MISSEILADNRKITKNKIDKNISNVLSLEIDQFVNGELENIRKNMELATKSYLDLELERRFLKVSRDLDMLENS